MATVICDKCTGKTDTEIYCADCYQALKDEIEELESEVGKLDRANESLQAIINDLRRENKILNERRE